MAIEYFRFHAFYNVYAYFSNLLVLVRDIVGLLSLDYGENIRYNGHNSNKKRN